MTTISTSSNPAISNNAAITPPTIGSFWMFKGPAMLLWLLLEVVKGEALHMPVPTKLQKWLETSLDAELPVMLSKKLIFHINNYNS